MSKFQQFVKNHEFAFNMAAIGTSLGLGAALVAVLASNVGAKAAISTVGRKELVVDVNPAAVAAEITKYLNNYKYRIDDELPQQILAGIRQIKQAEKAAKLAAKSAVSSVS